MTEWPLTRFYARMTFFFMLIFFLILCWAIGIVRHDVNQIKHAVVTTTTSAR